MSDGIFSTQDVADLELSQGVRRRIVNKLAGGALPETVEELGVLLSALKDVDAQVLKKARLTSDQQSAAAARAQTDVIAQMLTSMTMNAGKGDTNPSLAGELTNIDTVPGEMEVGDRAIAMEELDLGAGS